MKHYRKKIMTFLTAGVMAAGVLLAGCGSSKSQTSKTTQSSTQTAEKTSSTEETSSAKKAPKIKGLTYQSTLKLDYATQFAVYRYKGGYDLIDITGDAKYLLVPKGKKAPSGLSKSITVLKRPVNHIYLAATSSMSLFTAIDAMDSINMTSLNASGWSFEAPKKALKSGKMTFAGKYSEPDYEMLMDKKCHLAIESTMIYHTPEVKEMIENLGIPVMVDHSSYERTPLGRTEWIKLYGVLTGHEKQADDFFNKQKSVVEQYNNFKNTEKTVAFFYISTDGKAVVRRSDDYIPSMIETAGGRYIFKDLADPDGKTSIDMSVEKFYKTAENADYIIYDGSIDKTVQSLKDLKAKDPIMKNFKAVKDGNCWVTGTSMYQRVDTSGNMTVDIHKILTEKNPKDLEFLTKLK